MENGLCAQATASGAAAQAAKRPQAVCRCPQRAVLGVSVPIAACRLPHCAALAQGRPSADRQCNWGVPEGSRPHLQLHCAGEGSDEAGGEHPDASALDGHFHHSHARLPEADAAVRSGGPSFEAVRRQEDLDHATVEGLPAIHQGLQPPRPARRNDVFCALRAILG